VKVLVTGGAGFIGANVCRELAGHPDVGHVIALDDLSTGYAQNLSAIPAELVKGSILDKHLLGEVVDSADAVIHLAALASVPRSLIDPMRTHEVNVTGTINVLEACRRRKVHVVAASSSSVYGSVQISPKSEDLPTRPLSPYAASKLGSEANVLAYGESFELPVLALRFFNVYGPMQSAGHAYAAVIPRFIDAALRGKPIHIHGDGQQVRDFTFVRTVTEILVDALLRRVTSPTPVNLAFGTRTSVERLADHVAAAVGVLPKVEYGPARPGDVRDSQADARLLQLLFPNTKPVELVAGLEETVDWFREMRAAAGGAGDEGAPIALTAGDR
jgi:UDP-glucose 4-epimerase